MLYCSRRLSYSGYQNYLDTQTLRRVILWENAFAPTAFFTRESGRRFFPFVFPGCIKE